MGMLIVRLVGPGCTSKVCLFYNIVDVNLFGFMRQVKFAKNED